MDREKNIKRLHELLDLCLDVNGLEERCRDRTGNKPTVFFRLSGHISTVTIEAYENGWSMDGEHDFSATVDFGKDISDTQMNAIRGALLPLIPEEEE